MFSVCAGIVLYDALNFSVEDVGFDCGCDCAGFVYVGCGDGAGFVYTGCGDGAGFVYTGCGDGAGFVYTGCGGTDCCVYACCVEGTALNPVLVSVGFLVHYLLY